MQLNTVLAVLAGFCLAYVAADLFSQAGTMRQAIAAPPTKVETLAQQLQLYQVSTDDALSDVRARHAELSEAVARLDAYLRAAEAATADEPAAPAGQLSLSAKTASASEPVQAGG